MTFELHYREEIRSKVDQTAKLIYTLERGATPNTVQRYTIEVGVIQKGDGKNILCVPTQTNCAQACRFCHTTELAGKVAVANLTDEEISGIVCQAWIDAKWINNKLPLLVSFMGAGEPLANLAELYRAMLRIRTAGVMWQIQARFGLATMMPTAYLSAFQLFTEQVAISKLPLKVHLSLHYTTTAERKHWMPAAAPVHESLQLLREYRKQTGNPIEIHYTLIATVNDTLGHIHELRRLLEADPIPVKFLRYNPLPGDAHVAPDDAWVDFLRSELGKPKYGIETEYYTSPGADIQAACGMFMASAYEPTKSSRPSPREIGDAVLATLTERPFPELVAIKPLSDEKPDLHRISETLGATLGAIMRTEPAVSDKPKSGTPEAAMLAIGILCRGLGNPAVRADQNTTMEESIVKLALARIKEAEGR